MTTLKDECQSWLCVVIGTGVSDPKTTDSLYAFLMRKLKQFAEEVRVTGGIEVAHGRATKKETELINNGWQSCQAVQAAKIEAALSRREGGGEDERN